MLNGDQEHRPPVEAVPDIIASPPGSKESKLSSGEPAIEDTGSPSIPTQTSTVTDTVAMGSLDMRTEDSPGAGPSTLPLVNDNGRSGNDAAAEEDKEMSFNVQPPTPEATAVSMPIVERREEEWSICHMIWRGTIYEFKVEANDLVYDFRRAIQEKTNVPPDRQKLVGLIKGSGKLSNELDGTRFGTLGVRKGDVKFTMIGTPEDQSHVDMPLSDVADDFDVLYSAFKHQADKLVARRAPLPSEDPRNKRKIQDVIKSCPITVMNEPRPGKGLLVLDLDYTIVDTKPLLAGSLPADECARPHMHEFLEMMYPHYDIVVWSQTHWMWLETKLSELGVIGGTRDYKICFVADRTPMFPIFSIRSDGQKQKHEVKPLEYFWSKFPHWSAKNTIHIDDLSRNFAMNPGEGLKIRAFKGAGTAKGANDRELQKLGPYLKHIATNCEDFTKLNHADWKKWNSQP